MSEFIFSSPCGDMILKSDQNGLSSCHWIKSASVNQSPKLISMKSWGNPAGVNIKSSQYNMVDSLTVTPDRIHIQAAVRWLEDYFLGRFREVDFEFNLTGTPFQLAVWHEIEKIPQGVTITYGELARKVGKEKSLRAVARACGANPLPVIIPCHRVVAAHGKTGGYTGGLDKKLFLLNHEISKERMFQPL